MKRAFSLRNQDPPMEPLPAARILDDTDGGGDKSDRDKSDRDLEVTPEGGRFGELLVRKQLVSRGAMLEALIQQTTKGKRLGAMLVELGALTDAQLAETLSEQLSCRWPTCARTGPSPTPWPSCPSTWPGSWSPYRCASAKASSKWSSATLRPGRCACCGSQRVRDLAVHCSDLGRDAGHRCHLPLARRHRNSCQGVTAGDAIRRGVRRRRPPLSLRPAREPTPRWSRSSTCCSPRRCGTGPPTSTSKPQDNQVRVRFRVDGALHDVTTLPAEMGPALVSRIKIMAGMNIVERRRPQDGQTSLEVDGRALDVRVATTPTIFGEKVTMRLLDKSRPLYTGADLGMPADTRANVGEARPVALRDGRVRRPDRQRQDHHALRHARGDQLERPQHHDHRGPRRVRPPVDQPDPDQRDGRRDLRRGAAVDPPPGPRRDPRRRDPRRRDGPDRGPVGAHRPPRPVVAARHRHRGGRPPPSRHGHRGLPRRLVGGGAASASAWSPDLPGVHPDPTSPPKRRWPSTARPAGPRRRRSASVPAATSAPTPATRTASASTSCCGSLPRSSASSSAGPPSRRSAAWPCRRACGRCSRRGSTWWPPTSRRISEIIRVIYAS